MAARLRKRAVVFAPTEAAIKLFKEVLVASVVNEQLCGTDDGFLTRRFFRSEASLGGCDGNRGDPMADTPLGDPMADTPLAEPQSL